MQLTNHPATGILHLHYLLIPIPPNLSDSYLLFLSYCKMLRTTMEFKILLFAPLPSLSRFFIAWIYSPPPPPPKKKKVGKIIPFAVKVSMLSL